MDAQVDAIILIISSHMVKLIIQQFSHSVLYEGTVREQMGWEPGKDERSTLYWLNAGQRHRFCPNIAPLYDVHDVGVVYSGQAICWWHVIRQM